MIFLAPILQKGSRGGDHISRVDEILDGSPHANKDDALNSPRQERRDALSSVVAHTLLSHGDVGIILSHIFLNHQLVGFFPLNR